MKLEAILQKLGLLQPGKIMYIGGSDVLPAPLKPEQERQAVAALEQSAPVLYDRFIVLSVHCAPAEILRREDSESSDLRSGISA